MREDDTEQMEVEDLASRRQKRIKQNTIGLPGIHVSPARAPKIRSVPVNHLEEELGTASKLLQTIDATIQRCKLDLQAAYNERGKHQRTGKGLNSSSSLQHDFGLAKLQSDIGRLEKSMTSRRHTIPTNKTATDTIPFITNYTRGSRELDARLQNALREPTNNQLSTLADILTNTSTAPSVKSFNIMISRLSRLRQNAAAWVIFQAMLRLKYQPDAYTISSMLNLCIVSGSYADFSKILMAAREQRRIHKLINPARQRSGRGLILISTIIKGCVKFGRMRRAEVYITLMKSERIKANLEILTTMLQGYTASKDWERGRPHLRKLMYLAWDRRAVATLIKYCRTCDHSELEDKVRELAALKGVVVDRADEDLAWVPTSFKTKGLDVPNHLKLPGKNDIGALSNHHSKNKSSSLKRNEHKKGDREKVFVGTRREALGKWA